jgi:hypothetical protein
VMPMNEPHHSRRRGIFRVPPAPAGFVSPDQPLSLITLSLILAAPACT